LFDRKAIILKVEEGMGYVGEIGSSKYRGAGYEDRGKKPVSQTPVKLPPPVKVPPPPTQSSSPKQ
jgi:hypothetical protein